MTDTTIDLTQPPTPAATTAIPGDTPTSPTTPVNEPSGQPTPTGTPRRWLPATLAVAGSMAIVIAVSLACWQWKHVYADFGFIAPTVGSAVIGAATASVAIRFNRSRPLSLLCVTGVVLILLAALYRTEIANLPSDLIGSWKALASTGLLIPTTPRFLVVPVLVAGFATWLATDLFLRRATVALSALTILLAHGVVLAYTTSQHNPTFWYVGALALLVVGLLAFGGLRRPGDTDFADGDVFVSGRQLGSATVVVVLVASITAGLTTVIGGGSEPFDLRERLVRPLDIEETATPLARVKAGLIDIDDNSVFVIEVAGLGPDQTVELLPVAILDRFDGRIWSTAATFEPAGSHLPLPIQAPATDTVVDQTVTLTGDYPFRFLPQAGVLRTVAAGDVAWDPRNGTTATINPDDRYFEGQVALVAQEGRPSSGPVPGNNPVDLTDDQRAALNAYLAEVIDADDDVLVQLEKIETNLISEDFGYNIDAPAGHSLAALVSFLSPDSADTNNEDRAGRIGFAEHSAAAFAVLARQLGVPSRVVVGYRLDEPLTADVIEKVVTENMIHAWPEVWLEDRGWVRFEPTNTLNQTADQATRTPTVSSAGVDANRTDLPDLEEPILLAESDAVSGQSNWWWLAGFVLLAPLYGVLVVSAKFLRRTRRRRQQGDRGVVGAWRELMDRFAELGLPSSRALSANDVAEQLEVIDLRPVSEPVTALAPALDVALYSPQQATDAENRAAWSAAADALSLARRSSSARSRVRAALDPRALFSR